MFRWKLERVQSRDNGESERRQGKWDCLLTSLRHNPKLSSRNCRCEVLRAFRRCSSGLERGIVCRGGGLGARLSPGRTQQYKTSCKVMRRAISQILLLFQAPLWGISARVTVHWNSSQKVSREIDRCGASLTVRQRVPHRPRSWRTPSS